MLMRSIVTFGSGDPRRKRTKVNVLTSTFVTSDIPDSSEDPAIHIDTFNVNTADAKLANKVAASSEVELRVLDGIEGDYKAGQAFM